MNDKPDHLIGLVAELDPLDPSELRSLLARQDSAARFERIVVAPRHQGDAGAKRSPRARARTASLRRRRYGLAALGAVCAGAVAAIALLAASAFSPAPVSAAVSFSAKGKYIVAKIVNPYATAAQLKREFARNGLHISVHLIPGASGSVGHIAAVGESRTHTRATSIQVLDVGRKCDFAWCAPALKIPRNYSGSGAIYMDAPAHSGQRYESGSQFGAFSPREALYCSDLLGAKVSRLLPVLASKHLRIVRWRTAEASSSAGRSDAHTSNAYVWMVSEVAKGQVEVVVSHKPLDAALQRLAGELRQHC